MNIEDQYESLLRRLEQTIATNEDNWNRVTKLCQEANAKLEYLRGAIQRFEGCGHVEKCAYEMALQACDAGIGKEKHPNHPEKCDCGWADVEAGLYD